MDKKDFEALALVRLDRAKELYFEANELVRMNSYRSANNRAFYALPIMMTSILLIKKRRKNFMSLRRIFLEKQKNISGYGVGYRDKYFLFGISSVGKTAIGRLLAEKPGYKYYDLDEEGKARCHMTLGYTVVTKQNGLSRRRFFGKGKPPPDS